MDGSIAARSSTGAALATGRPWRWWLLVAGMALVWAVLRLSMNREYREATWADLLQLDAPLPFGHRILVPLLARPLVSLGIDLPVAWGAFEVVSMVALVVLVERILGIYIDARPARLLAVSTLGLLPLAFLLPHRWPIYYPWDAPAMAFVAAGTWAVLRRRFALAWMVTAVAALNRESALLVPVCAVVLTLHDETARRRTVPWAGLMVATYALVRWGIDIALPDNPGPPLHFTVGGDYRLFHNLRWLADPVHVGTFVGSLAFVPLSWPAVSRHVPTELQRMHLPVVAATLGLTIVANVYEPRAFGEVIVLGWLCVAAGLGRWLSATREAPEARRPSWLVLVDRFGALAMLVAWIGFALALNRWSFLPVAQWPMP